MFLQNLFPSQVNTQLIISTTGMYRAWTIKLTGQL